MCNANGRPTPEISWQVNGSPVDEDSELFNIMDDGSLLLIGLKTTDCTVYTCTASNAVNADSESVTVCGESESPVIHCELVIIIIIDKVVLNDQICRLVQVLML